MESTVIVRNAALNLKKVNQAKCLQISNVKYAFPSKQLNFPMCSFSNKTNALNLHLMLVNDHTTSS